LYNYIYNKLDLPTDFVVAAVAVGVTYQCGSNDWQWCDEGHLFDPHRDQGHTVTLDKDRNVKVTMCIYCKDYDH
jgi:hypothetical protein